MKRIIKHGFHKYQAECDVCGCLFEYELEDIIEGGKVICPECGDKCLHTKALNAVWGSQIKEKENEQNKILD